MSNEVGKAAPTKAEVKKTEAEEKVIFDNYQKFAELMFLQWNGDKYDKKALKPNALKDFEIFEKEAKAFKTKNVPNVSKTIAGSVGMANVKIVKGYAVPDSLFEMLTDAQKDIYFS